MRYLFAASAINITESGNEKPDESKPVNHKVIEFLKKLTRHFVLLFIIKGDTQFIQIDQINPLSFLDILCDFVFEHYTTMQKNQDIVLTNGPEIAIWEIFDTLRVIYPQKEDIVKAITNLSFIKYLMKKICYKSNSQELGRKQGFLQIMKVLIDVMPIENLLDYNELIFKSALQILATVPFSAGSKHLQRDVYKMLLPYLVKSKFMKPYENVRRQTVKLIIEKLQDLNSDSKEICKIMLWKLILKDEVESYRNGFEETILAPFDIY